MVVLVYLLPFVALFYFGFGVPGLILFLVLIASLLFRGFWISEERILAHLSLEDGISDSLRKSIQWIAQDLDLPPTRRAKLRLSGDPTSFLLLVRAWKSSGTIVISRGWIESQTEVQIREALRRALIEIQNQKMPLRTTACYFTASLLRPMPPGIRFRFSQELSLHAEQISPQVLVYLLLVWPLLRFFSWLSLPKSSAVKNSSARQQSLGVEPAYRGLAQGPLS